jgi:hypothetical protein
MISARVLARQHHPKAMWPLEQLRARPAKGAIVGHPRSRMNRRTSDSLGERPIVYWFRLPDDEAMLMSLRPAELKCYLVVVRAIQRDRNKGKLSIRQIAERAQLSPKHAHTAVVRLVDLGLLACRLRPGVTGVYRLPSEWRDRTPTRERLGREPEGQGEQYCAPPGEQNCTPAEEQHLEFSELSETSSSSNGNSSDMQQEKNKTEAGATTMRPATLSMTPEHKGRAERPTADVEKAMEILTRFSYETSPPLLHSF